MNTHYRHFNITSLQKAYTLCGVLSHKNTILVGMSVVHPNDQFSKAIGRGISYDNAHLKIVAELVIQEGDSVEYTFYSFASRFIPKQSFHRDIIQMSRKNEAMIIE